MKGTVFNLLKIIFVTFFILVIFILFYAVLPTVLIRISGRGITKKVKAKGIALTFDDGPDPVYTPQLLDLLKKYKVKASFFIVGSKAKNHPEIIKRMHQEGHTIGIHHFNHISGWLLTPFQLSKQLRETAKVIEGCTHERVSFYRPPWGHFNLFTPFISKNYHVIMWAYIFGDWKVENSKRLFNPLQTVTEDGSIVLLHDCGETLGADQEAPRFMIENLEKYIKECTEKGVHFITLKEL